MTILMATPKNPYETLGVKQSATQDEIRNAYRKQAKKHHPDLNPGSKAAEAKFKDLAGAYELIGTPEERTKFDRGDFDQAPHQQPGGGPFYYETQNGPGARYSQSFGEGVDAEDLFESLFGNARGGARGRGGPRKPSGPEKGPQKGNDESYQMQVDLRDTITGVERQITLPSGKTLSVKIPVGVLDGNKLRFAGQGGPGLSGGPAGDVFVEVKIKAPENFTQKDSDLLLEFPISLYEAVLGAEVKVPTIEGSVMMKIPPHANTGKRLRIPGKGVFHKDPVSGMKVRGDQIVLLKIVLPKSMDPELEAAILKSAPGHSYNPRSEESESAA
ncbi:MAG: J domain-containing protein [Methylotenera sp.]|nr:J domain-containing protein [Oligoflexia bacterium]